MDKSIKISMILLLLAGTLTLCACNADNKPADISPAQTVNTANTGTPVTPKTAAQTVDVMKSPTVSIQNKQATLTIPDEWLPKPEPEVVPEEEPVPEEKPSGKKAQTKQAAPVVSDPAAALLLDGVPLDIGLTPEGVPIADMNPTVNTSSESSESSSDVAYSKDDTEPAKEAEESYNWE